MSLIEKLKEYTNKNPEYLENRFFDCEGKPEDCKVHLIGVNPSLGLPNGKDFWSYWSDEDGFKFDEWLANFKEKVKSETKYQDGLKPTRKRIEELRKGLGETKLLNYNIFSKATKREADLTKEDKDTAIFRAIFSETKPSLIILQGSQAKKCFKKLTSDINDESPNWEFIDTQIEGRNVKIITISHMYNLALNENKNKDKNIKKLIVLVNEALGK